jgi:DNA-binding beta-propeller fold protein YncE
MRLPGILSFCVLAACAACGGDDDGPSTPVADAAPTPFVVNAQLTEAPPEARLPAGPLGDGRVVLPGMRRLTPSGTQLEVGGFPMALRLLPGGKHLLVGDAGYYDNYLSVVDTATGQIVQREPFKLSDHLGLYLGLAVRADGHVFASVSGTDAIWSFGYDASAAEPLAKVDELPLDSDSLPAGLAFADATRLVVALQEASAVALVDTASGVELGRLRLSGADHPYDVVVSPERQEAYVSLWGGRAVAVVDVAGATPTLLARVPVGKNPTALLLTPTRLLCASTDSDRVDVIDLATRVVVDNIPIAGEANAPRGAAPNHLALSPDGARLYVASAWENAVDVFSTADFSQLGRIPTGFYPTSVAVRADGGLYIANAKGLGGGPGGTAVDYGVMKGTLSILASAPDDAELASGAAQVDDNNRFPAHHAAHADCAAEVDDCRYPLPVAAGMPTPIQHVVLLVRENKTFDSQLGDLGGDTNGDPSLVLFGEHITPNLHKLARAFLVADNFYNNAEMSTQGHAGTTSGYINDFTEKWWLDDAGRGDRNVATLGTDIYTPEQGTYFQHLGRAGIDYVSYGEIVGLAGGGHDDAPVKIDNVWPGGVIWSTDVREIERAEYFAQTVEDGLLKPFTYMLLPNNHTKGLSSGAWTPEFMVADNDEATGRVIDALSHSPYWPSTVIFVIEDDPADTADHVEAHRSTFLAIGPWVKHGAVAHVNYDVASLWRTIELLVGLPPMSRATADAAPMYDLWASSPDLTPYTYVPSNVPEAFNKRGAGGALEAWSNRMDFSRVDRARGLGRVLWQHMKGTPAPWARDPVPLEYGDLQKIPVPFAVPDEDADDDCHGDDDD